MSFESVCIGAEVVVEVFSLSEEQPTNEVTTHAARTERIRVFIGTELGSPRASVKKIVSF
jgi:hypothetical protein